MPEIEEGQRWRSKRTGQVVKVVSYNSAWDDVTYRNTLTGRKGDIYAVNLRVNYELVSGSCIECGNDDAAEGYAKCTDCLEETGV